MLRPRCLGIVREVYSKWERRVPLCPEHVRRLVKEHDIRVLVQPSTRRVFPDDEFIQAGAEVTDDLSPANLILGVKQVPVKFLLPDRTYMFFSHTIKAQADNMPLLDAVLDRKVTLVDYECVRKGGVPAQERLIAFGRFAGLAGMVDTLSGLGRRLLSLGHSTPLLNVAPCYTYASLDAALSSVDDVARRLGQPGNQSWIEALSPFVFTFTGHGKVCNGALEVFNRLPHTMVNPNDLEALQHELSTAAPNSTARRRLYGCIAEAEHMVQHPTNPKWTRQEYFDNPQAFVPVFHKNVLPHTSVLVNAMYWDQRFPRLVTVEQAQELAKEGKLRLLMDADLTCDLRGSVEFLTQSTSIEQPFYVWDPTTNTASSDIETQGVVMLGVDILPAELPREASKHFGDILIDFIPKMIDHQASSPHTELPAEIANACIASQGKLTERYKYIADMRRVAESKQFDAAGAADKPTEPKEPSLLVLVKGHLFDTSLVNMLLNLVESRGVHFKVLEIDVLPNSEQQRNESSVLLKLSSPLVSQLIQTTEAMRQLADLTPLAQASIQIIDHPHDPQQPTSKESSTQSSGGGSSSGSSGASTGLARDVLVLGAGLVSGPLLRYLVNTCGRSVLAVSAVASELETLQRRFPALHVQTLNAVKDADTIEKLVKESGIVISLLPAPMHPPVARMCLRHSKNLVTASYVSADMRSMHEEAKSKGLVFLNEMGLDPGMDHMSAMRVIDHAQSLGGKVRAFSSVCGGLPAPEAATNPLAYKFSWSPRGVLSATKNSAVFLRNGQTVRIPGEQLLQSVSPATLLPSLSLECLPNRDSLSYADVYKLSKTAHSIFRGTLRYKGFCDILSGMTALGLLNDQPVPELAPNTPGDLSWAELMNSRGLGSAASVTHALLATGRTEAASEATANCLGWLGCFSTQERVQKRGTLMDTLCALLELKLQYEPGERDMVLMQHIFDIENANGTFSRHTSTLIGYGDPNGDTAMSKTVGLTAAIGAHLVLDGRITQPGVLMPTEPEVYLPCLEILEREGWTFKEASSELQQ
eukprot:c17957_g1_i1.p1 GENE.c17957_g1_i1~~c17957_g1_i1.p1  ORF type:complete len:1041 (+),score=246.16 c17957_g1_i1:38-3160(+)